MKGKIINSLPIIKETDPFSCYYTLHITSSSQYKQKRKMLSTHVFPLPIFSSAKVSSIIQLITTQQERGIPSVRVIIANFSKN
jgi:hypothetical protein